MKFHLSLCAIAVIAAGCSSSTPTTPPGPDPIPQETITAVLQEAGKVAALPDEVHEYQETVGDVVGSYRTVTEAHDDTYNIQDITHLGLNDAVIFPGSLVKGDRIQTFVYDPITAPRAPVTLSISLLGSPGSPSISEVVANPGQLSSVRQGVSNLVNRALTGGSTAPAQVQWDYTRVHDQSQMSTFVKADIHYGAGSLDTAFNWNTGADKTRIVAKYTQIYYSVDMDTPASPGAVLASGISESQLRTAFPAGSMPMYVSGVKYGLMAICTIESNYTEEQMDLALNASYSGVVDADIEVGLTARQVMNSSTIKVIVYGGSTEGIQELNTFDGFMGIIRSSTTFTPQSLGVPLVYVFRNLKDNTLSQIALTSQYSIERQVKVRQGVRVTVDRFVCESSADDECFANAYVDINSLQVVCNAFSRVTGSSPLEQINTANESVYNWTSDSYDEMHAGSIHPAGTSIDLVFNTEDYDPAYQVIRLAGWANDYDACSGNENGWSAPFNINGVSYGPKSFNIITSDFNIRAEVTISPID